MLAPVLLLLAASAPAPAAYSAQYTTCMEASGGVTVDMRACISAEHARQDRRLNAAYRALSRCLDGERRRELQAAQRAWLPWRQAECRHRASGEIGGTLWAVLVDDCQLETTRERADAFEDQLRTDRELSGD